MIRQKKKIVHRTPIQVSGIIYAHAKLRMLRFQYDYLYSHCDLRKLELGLTDTDSLAIGMSEASLAMCVRPEMSLSFYEKFNEWFPREACDECHDDWMKVKIGGGKGDSEQWPKLELRQACCRKANLYDQRTTGLFKEEFANGDVLVALCAKTYICLNENDKKASSKGMQHRRNGKVLTAERYLNVIKNARSDGGQNAGFQYDKRTHAIRTYTQDRASLSYYYQKRLVLPDGVTTTPLENV